MGEAVLAIPVPIAAPPPPARAPLPQDRQRITKKGILCGQCWNRKKPSEFRTHPDGTPHRQCNGCKTLYADWTSLSPEERLARMATKDAAFEVEESYRVLFVAKATNRKLGPMPATYTARGSCPEACSFKNAGCFAETSFTKKWWKRAATEGLTWTEFCEKVAALPRKPPTLWRLNEAGDLPGRGNAIDPFALRQLIEAARGTRVIAFTHKPVLYEKTAYARARAGVPTEAERRLWTDSNRRAIAHANRSGFVINLSADGVEEADRLADLRIAPVVAVVPHDAPARAHRTPAGRQLVFCPAETHGMTCAECQLCAVPNRASIVAFRSHGQSKKLVDTLVRSKRAP